MKKSVTLGKNFHLRNPSTIQRKANLKRSNADVESNKTVIKKIDRVSQTTSLGIENALDENFESYKFLIQKILENVNWICLNTQLLIDDQADADESSSLINLQENVKALLFQIPIEAQELNSVNGKKVLKNVLISATCGIRELYNNLKLLINDNPDFSEKDHRFIMVIKGISHFVKTYYSRINK